MAVLVSDILDHPCDTDDEKMKTIYETDYVKRGKMFHVLAKTIFLKNQNHCFIPVDTAENFL